MTKKINHILSRFRDSDLPSSASSRLCQAMKALGYQSEIYVFEILDAFSSEVKPIHELNLQENAVFVFHTDGFDFLNKELLAKVMGKKVLFRHFTPELFHIAPFHNHDYYSNKWCLEELEKLAVTFDLALTDSQVVSELIRKNGYSKVHTLSNLYLPRDYRTSDCEFSPSPFSNGDETSFVVRAPIQPNQKIEDSIRLFAWYQKWIQPKSRLLILGSQINRTYFLSVQDVVHSLKIQNKVFFIENPELIQIAAAYRDADLVISLAETDFYRFDLLDSLYFDVPVLSSKNSGSVEVFKNSGCYILGKDIPVHAEITNSLIHDQKFRDAVIRSQKARLNQVVQQNSLESLGRELEQVLNSLDSPLRQNVAQSQSSLHSL